VIRSKGSLTVEAAFIMPLVIAAVLFVMYVGFFLHDRTILAGLASETAFWGEHAWQAGEQVDESTMDSAYKAFAGNKMFLTKNVIFYGEIHNNKVEVRLTADSSCGWPFPFLTVALDDKTTVFSECPAWQPEKIIRETRRIMDIKEDLTE